MGKAVEMMEISSDKMENNQLEVPSRKGGLKTMPFIIANETLEKVASIGLNANMILYLKNEYHLDTATGASILFLWGALSNFTPTGGAFLSDSFLGRFRVIALGTFITLMGITVLWLTAIFQEARPPHCEEPIENCSKPNSSQLALLFSAFILMSIGAGGVRPCSLAFGADQFDNPDDPKNHRTLQSFFNWYYASVGISILISVTVIVYIQDAAGWVVGFGVPVGLMLFSAVMYLLGSKLYVKVKPKESLFSSLARVLVVAFKNRHLRLPPVNSDDCYYHKKGSKLVAPTEKLRFLNKACLIRIPYKDTDLKGNTSESFISTVQQVEELKALIKVLPIWSAGIIIAITISPQPFPVVQALTMNRHLAGKFKIPPGSFSVFGIITLTIWIAIYDRIIVPILAKFTKRKNGLTQKERIGIGIALACVASSVSAIVESIRRKKAIEQGFAENPLGLVDMSAMWLVPQHCLTGLAEAFNAIGQIEFFYSQFPKNMASIGVALFSLGMCFGNLLASLLVTVMGSLSRRGGNVSWVSNNINQGHYDYYYWTLAILLLVNLLYFLLCSWAYGSCEQQRILEEEEGMEEEEDDTEEYKSPMLDFAKSKESPLISTV